MNTKWKLHHIALKVCDLEKTKEFYSQLLDLQPSQFQKDNKEQIRSYWFDLSGCLFMLEKQEAPTNTSVKKPTEDGWHLLSVAIDVSQRDQIKQRLHELKIPIQKESPYSIYILDPENNWVAFSHYPEAAVTAVKDC